jgi:hydrogenase expression/formation protein HypD
MKYIDEFRDNRITHSISKAVFRESKGLERLNIMEVCGTHTMAICNFGIKEILPGNIGLISGPGCPVCVTPKYYIDKAIAISRMQGVILTTFGDMMRVPGSGSSLNEERAAGRQIRVVYSVLDAVEIARKNRDKKIVFLGIGFETTAPTVAAGLISAKKERLKNFFILSGHKVMLPAMEALVKDRDVKIDGFLCPAHVSTIIGTGPYSIIADKYNIPCVIAGFEPVDILQGVFMLVKQIKSGKAKVENQYKRVAKNRGNKKAMALMREVFAIKDSEWRGIGVIKNSGLYLNKQYSGFDAEASFVLPKLKTRPDPGCICGSVLKGIKTPIECRLFGNKCTPENPQGACMVSSEGACAAYYRYKK